MSRPSKPPSAPDPMTRPLFNPADWPIAWMARAERQHARNATALLAPLGIHHREFRLLALLGHAEQPTVGELAELAVLERPTVSKMLDRLEAEGWVRRGRSAQDGRHAKLALTAAGRAKLRTAAPIVEDLFRRYQQGTPADEQARFVCQLQDFYRRVQHAGNAHPSA